MARDYYEILGVTRTVTEVELKGAFRKAAMQHHPDRNPGDPEAEVRFKECNEAYSVLSDADKRAAYDRFGHAGVNGAGPGGGQGGFQNMGDIFSEVFGDAFGEMFNAGRRSSGPARGQDLRYDVEITLEQAYAGDEIEVRYPIVVACEVCDGSGARPGTQPTNCSTCGGAGRVRATQGFFSVERACPRCGGRGKVVADPCRNCQGAGQVRQDRTLQVRIPAGVDDGARIRLAGEGDAGPRGGARGDLYIFVALRAHELFERDGMDLHCTVPVPMSTAALGGEIEAPCLNGNAKPCEGDCKVKVKIPEGSQTGANVRLKGKGMPSLRGARAGRPPGRALYRNPHPPDVASEGTDARVGRELRRRHRRASPPPRHAGFFSKARKFWGGLTGHEEERA